MKKYFTVSLALLLSSFLALTLFYCGGGGDSSSGDDGGTATPTYDVNVVANRITGTLGEDGGIDAVILAIDQGYSATQIAYAGMNDRLSKTGEISDRSGSIVPPEYPPGDISASGATSKGIKPSAIGPKDLELIRKTAKAFGIDFNEKAATITLALLARGYSKSQIIDDCMFSQKYLVDKRKQPWDSMEGYYLHHPTEYPDLYGTWSDDVTCTDILWPFRWEIYLFLKDITDYSKGVSGDIYFHKCPGGGKVHYGVDGKLDFKVILPKRPAKTSFFTNLAGLGPIKDYAKLIGAKFDGDGPLHKDSPDSQNFAVVALEPPIPNLAGEKDTDGKTFVGRWTIWNYERCDNRIFTVGGFTVYSDGTWEKDSFAGGSCMPEKDSTWSITGSTIRLNGTAAGCSHCYYEGTLNSDFTRLDGKEHLTCGGFQLTNCIKATKDASD